MAIFLDGLSNYITFDFGYQFNTLISTMENGTEERRAKWSYPRRHANIKCTYLLGTNSDTAWDFYIARKGSYEHFTWFLPVSDAYTYEYVGQGDGSTTAFDINAKTISSYTVYIDGVAKTEVTHYSIGAATGTDGRARVTFVTAPSAGEIIEISFTGYLGLYYRFKDDNLTRPMFTTALQQWGLEILEDKLS